MAQYAPNPLTSIHGRRIGLGPLDEIVLGYRDQVLSGVVFANIIASSAVSNTTAETAFDQKYTIPANFLRPGSVIKVKFQGIATATNSTDTLAIKLYLGGVGGTVLLSLAARDVANNDIFYGEAEIIIRSIGATGSFVATGTAPANPNAAGTAVTMSFVAATALNTTIANDIAVSATWSAASAGDSCRLDILRVEIA